MQQYTILDARWWNTTDALIGAVAVQTDESGEWKGYIGAASGFNLRQDEQTVARDGAGLSPDEAHVFFPRLLIGQYKDYHQPARPISGEEPEGDLVPGTIGNVGYGLRDIPGGQPGLWFVVAEKGEAQAFSLQCFVGDEANNFIIENQIRNILDLNGRECFVRVKGGQATFVRLA